MEVLRRLLVSVLLKQAINSTQSLEVISKCLDLYGDSRSTPVAFTASALT